MSATKPAGAFVADGHEIAAHGYRWLGYAEADEATEHPPI